MTVAHARDLAVIDPDAFEQATETMSVKGRNEIMRELGHVDMIVSTKAQSDPMAKARAAASRRRNMQTRQVAAAMPF